MSSISTIYIPDRKVAKYGEDELFSAIQDIERKSPDALHIIDGDFNHGSLHPGIVNMLLVIPAVMPD